MKRKRAIAAMLVMLLGVCTGLFAEGGQEAAAGPVTITVWDWFAGSKGSQGVLAAKLDEAFQKKYPDINVNHESVPHPPYDVYQAAIVGKEGADSILVHANGQNFQDLGEAFVILDDHIEEMRDQFPVATLADCSPERDVSNGIRGLPMTVQGWVWYYNKQLFGQAGVDADNPPTTWDGLLEACAKLEASGTIPVGFGKGIHAEMMIAGTLDQVLSDQEKRGLLSGAFKFTDPKCVVTYEKFADLFQRGYMDPEGLTVPLLREKGEEFMAGKSAIFRGFISDIFNWFEFGQALGAENLGVIPNFYVPPSTHREVVGAAGGVAYAVPLYSDKEEAAVKWVKFTASVEGANLLLKTGGAVPANKEADRSLVANQVGVDIMKLIANKLVPPTKAFTQTAQWNVLRSHAPLMLTGDISPREYGEEIEKARE
jgi:ABC-type glycerol-3-phosphate transport system substrate-binding protein